MSKVETKHGREVEEKVSPAQVGLMMIAFGQGLVSGNVKAATSAEIGKANHDWVVARMVENGLPFDEADEIAYRTDVDLVMNHNPDLEAVKASREGDGLPKGLSAFLGALLGERDTLDTNAFPGGEVGDQDFANIGLPSDEDIARAERVLGGKPSFGG